VSSSCANNSSSSCHRDRRSSQSVIR
jgi:hypothetical protein